MLNRRYQSILAFFVVFTICVVLLIKTLPGDVPAVNAVTDRIPKSLPSLHKAINPFAPAAHEPPIQANSSSGGVKWYSDWRWRNPFSWSVTLDENREVLPPLRMRPLIYTYYEPDPKKSVQEAEEKLLLQWRRAWWAQGFKPIVLGRPEAINNPLYRKVQQLQLNGKIEMEIASWLAWGNMGTGILTHWRAFPMSSYEDVFLSFLRRGSYPQLTRFEGLEGGIFYGEKAAIRKAIDQIISDPEVKDAQSLADSRFSSMFKIEPTPSSIAIYDNATLESKYKSISKILFSPQTKDEGLQQLGSLINSHLHMTWQTTFSSGGIAVVRPLATHMSTVYEPAIDIATNLTQCPSSPEPTTCPPNMSKNCKRCISSQPLNIATVPTFQNRSNTFHISIVPHPYTTLTLINEKDDGIDTRFVRRLGMNARDPWLKEVTKDTVGTGPSLIKRITFFKQAVAGS